MGALRDEDVQRLYRAAIDAGLGGSRDTLLAGLPQELRASLPTASSPQEQIVSDVHTLNEVLAPDDGTHPLARWIALALDLVRPRKQARVFEELLERICQRPEEAPDIRQSKLWRELARMQTDEAQRALRMLEACVRRILDEVTAAEAEGVVPGLQGKIRAVRIAEWMGKIVPSAVVSALSGYEIALLVLAALLHDVGFTAEQRRLARHYEYLCGDDPNRLSEGERDALQRWLDEETEGRMPPPRRETDEQDPALDVLLRYHRFERNTWCTSWIEQNIPATEIGGRALLSDLALLCKSVNEEFASLRRQDLTPTVGSVTVHLRYLACVLRVASALEPVLIWGGSRNRDPVSITIEPELPGDRAKILLAAQPTDAKAHHGIERFADDIDHELALCVSLGEHIPFDFCPGTPRKLPHRWQLPSSVSRHIRPRHDAYEYIDGSFRPDTKKLLELLGGVELYGNPLAAVRELIQNAMDAIREQIALERLEQRDPLDPNLVKALQFRHWLKLRIEERRGRVFLICSDTGAGMTKRIIRDHLLVSGSSRRAEIVDLERRCNRRGFSIERTGQFGIGVLSYFMLADRVVIRTQRSQICGEAPESGWEFETEGVGSFGELRKFKKVGHGTEVELRIRPECVKGGIRKFSDSLTNYLGPLLMYLPCQFEFTPPEGLPQERGGPGWLFSLDELKQLALYDAFVRDGVISFRRNRTPVEMLSPAELEDRQTRDRQWAELRDEMGRGMQIETREFALPDGLGRARIHLPWFDLPRGKSVAFMRVREQRGRLMLDEMRNGLAYRVRPGRYTGLRGIRVNREPMFDAPDRIPVIEEIDWTSARVARISVDRRTIEINHKRSDAAHALRFIARQIRLLRREFLAANGASPYDSLNRTLLLYPQGRSKIPKWVSLNGSQVEWKELRFPATHATQESELLEWNQKPVSFIRELAIARPEPLGNESIAWASKRDSPDRVALYQRGGDTRLVPLWTGAPKLPRAQVAGLTSRFPPKWMRVVCGARLRLPGYKDIILWNSTNPLIARIDEDGWRWAAKVFHYKTWSPAQIDPLPYALEMSSNRSRAASWIAICLADRRERAWESVKARKPILLQEIWHLVFGEELRAVSFWDERDGLHTIDQNGWSTRKSPRIGLAPENDLPDPGDEWRVRVRE